MPKHKKISRKAVGNKFHDRTRRLFEKMGFQILTSDYNIQGPDIIVKDLEANKSLKILVQCKKSDGKKTYPSLQSLVDEYSAKLKRYKARRSIIFISGYKPYSGFNFNKTLEESGVAVVADDLIGYYEDLVSKIGSFAKYQFLSDIGLGAEFADKKIVKAIKVQQKGGLFYIFSTSPDWLLKTATVARRISFDKGMKGYQRLLKKKRVIKEIPDFLIKENWVLPNSIICIGTSEKPIIYNNNKVELDSRYGAMWVIDGQHRLYSFANTDNEIRKKSEIICVLFDKSSLGPQSDIKQAEIFIDLNQHAKKVDRSLILELGEMLGENNPALKAVIKLGKTALFKGMIRGYSSNLDGTIKMVTFVDNAAMQAIVDHFKKKNPSFSDDKLSELIYKKLLKYFRIVKSGFGKKWADKRFIISENRGIRALLKICHKLINDNIKFDRSLIYGFKRLNKNWNFSFETKDLVRKYAGEAGADDLASDWLNYILGEKKLIPENKLKLESLLEYIENGEDKTIEFKSSIWWDVDQTKYNDERQADILRTIVGFLNSDGGLLIIGVNNEGQIVGIKKDLDHVNGKDLRDKKDKLKLRLTNLFRGKLVPDGRIIVSGNIGIDFVDDEKGTVCVVRVKNNSEPVFLSPTEDFYIREDASTIKLKPSQIMKYIKNNFK